MPDQEETLLDLNGIDFSTSVREKLMQNLNMIAAISSDCVDNLSACQELMPE